LQGSGETHFRCGVKCYRGYVHNLLLILTVKEFWKSVSIRQSYERM